MMPKFLIAACWAGVISLDFTGMGPWMLSQPMVCGPLFGWLLGHAAVGLIVGGIAQMLWMDVTPVGVGIPYDATAATLLAVYWACLPAHPSLSQIVLAVLIAMPFGFIFKWIDQTARRLNSRLIRKIEAVPDEHLPAAMDIGIAMGLTLAFLRYTVCYAAALWAGQWLWNLLAYEPRMTQVDRGLTMAVVLLPVAGMGVCLELLLSEGTDTRWDPLRPFLGSRRKDPS